MYNWASLQTTLRVGWLVGWYEGGDDDDDKSRWSRGWFVERESYEENLTARSNDSGGGEVEQTGTNIGRGNGLGWDME